MRLEPGYELLLERASREVASATSATIVHHDDADGLAAGAIAYWALKVLGVEARLVCIEKMHPAIVRAIHSVGADLVLYADIGSGRADLVERELKAPQKAIILDHHDPVRTTSESLLHLNPELFGYKGESEASGSTSAYMLARKLVGERAKRIAWAAVVGSAEIPGELRGLNRVALDDAVSVGDVEVVKRGGQERYLVKGLNVYWDNASRILTLVGSVGYYKGGPETAVKSIIERSLPRGLAKKLEEERRKAFNALFSKLKRLGVSRGENIQWVSDYGLFRGMGSKTIGTFLSLLRFKSYVDPEKYLVGIMRFNNEIPGLGRIEGEWLKVSIRLPPRLTELVRSGKKPPASRILVEASQRVGGVADGHAFAASGLIPKKSEEEFLKELDKLAGR